MTHHDATTRCVGTRECAVCNNGLFRKTHPEPKECPPAILRELWHGKDGWTFARLARDVHMLRRRTKRRGRETAVGVADRRGIHPAGDSRSAGVRLRRAHVAAEGGREQLGREAKAGDRYYDISSA